MNFICTQYTHTVSEQAYKQNAMMLCCFEKQVVLLAALDDVSIFLFCIAMMVYRTSRCLTSYLFGDEEEPPLLLEESSISPKPSTREASRPLAAKL